MGRLRNLIVSLVYACVLSLAGCNCGAHHDAPDDDAAGDDGGLDPHEGVGGDDASAGAAGRDGASGEGGTDAQPPEDAGRDAGPAPMMIPTSGSQAVLLVGLSDDSGPQRVIALDLASSETHVLAVSEDLSFGHASPDGTAVLFGGNERSREDNFFIVRLLDGGVVTAAAVTGVDGDVGDRQLLGWSYDSRFVLLSRTSVVGEHGIDLIDVHSGARRWSAEGDVTSMKSARFAPRGHWFSYALTGPRGSSGIARVTASGIDDIEVPQFIGEGSYSQDGSRIAYTLQAGTGVQTYYRDLAPDADANEIRVDEVPDATGFYPVAFSGEEHLLVQVLTGAGPTELRRVELATFQSEEIALPEMSHVLAHTTSVSSLLGVQPDNAAGEDTLLLVDPLGEHDAVPIETIVRDPPSTPLIGPLQLGAAGPDHFFYTYNFATLTFVARAGDGSAAVSVVSLEDELGFGCLPQPAETTRGSERLALTTGPSSEALLMVDLSQAMAQRVARYDAPHGGAVLCPVWNAARDSFAFVEVVGGETVDRAYLYKVDWPAAGSPEEPELVFEAEDSLSLLAYRP